MKFLIIDFFKLAPIIASTYYGWEVGAHITAPAAEAYFESLGYSPGIEFLSELFGGVTAAGFYTQGRWFSGVVGAIT